MIVSSDVDYEHRALDLAGGLTYEYIAPDPTKPRTSLEGIVQRRARGELANLRKQLFLSREYSPLFDTQRWVRNLEKVRRRHVSTGFLLAHADLMAAVHQGLIEAWRRYVSGAEFEDSPEWGRGDERKAASIWITDDNDGANWPAREPYSH